jgi:hypothetical protein
MEEKQLRSTAVPVPFDDDAVYRTLNKVELTAGARGIPEARKRRFIVAVQKRAKQRAHAKACAKRRRK